MNEAQKKESDQAASERKRSEAGLKAAATRKANAAKVEQAQKAARSKPTKEPESPKDVQGQDAEAEAREKVARRQREADTVLAMETALESPEQPAASPFQDPSFDSGVATPVLPRGDTGHSRSPLNRP